MKFQEIKITLKKKKLIYCKLSDCKIKINSNDTYQENGNQL